MNILVSAGNTQVPIDQVRCITNVFTGRTGTSLALHAYDRGHAVTLLTSRPEAISELRKEVIPTGERWKVVPYRTFDELHQLLQDCLKNSEPDAFIHSAAVSDYRVNGVWYVPEDERGLRDAGAGGKIKSHHEELWLRLVRTPKLIDLVRQPWGFQGILVKFKLEVGITEEELLKIAEPTRKQSAADLLVANTLEGAGSWALLGPTDGSYRRVSRQELAQKLLDEVERLHKERTHG